MKSLRARWMDLRRNPRVTLMYYLVTGMHVEDPETEEFNGVRVIQENSLLSS